MTERKNPNDPLSVDLHEVVLPDDTPYEDFSVDERRAVLLSRIEQVGHPRALNQTYAELGDEFGVCKQQIGKDMKFLAQWCAENVEREHVSIMDAVFRKVVLRLSQSDDTEDLVAAADVGARWFEWLADMGAIERVPDRLDMRVSDETATEDYEVLDDAEFEQLVAHGDGTVSDPDALPEGGA